ncbi:hypothetical protein DHEL01_v210077 [Diaporthe helianthi]|uniref:Uncharacterized protein n=1 Tax=Diaporthe helianthi TaxID=158607 RepID=A0A2P5HMR9_DIAHE|nr:hypothetical protein DHEL01_v210077 [Diaporthe helianthi]
MPLNRTRNMASMSLPAEFPGYNELPTDLKLQVVREATAELKNELPRIIYPDRFPKKAPLAKYACLDLVWRDIIERYTFGSVSIKRDDIKAFGRICHKRQGILGKITLCPDSHKILAEMGSGWVYEHGLNHVKNDLQTSLQALFNTMKDWKPEERRRPGLIKVCIHLMNLRYFPLSLRTPISIDFSGLPTVNVVEEFFQDGPGFSGQLLDPRSTIAIYRKLPNLEAVTLDLPVSSQPTESELTMKAMSALHSLRRLPHVPSRVSIFSTCYLDGYRSEGSCQAELPVLKFLATPGPRWSDNITDLYLRCINNVPQFFEQFQTTSWSQLRKVYLSGRPGGTHFARDGDITGIVKSLIGAVFKMPKATAITLCLATPIGHEDMDMRMILDPDGSFQYNLPFVPRGNKGFAQFHAVDFPGYLAEQLQDAIWKQYGRELDVFCTPQGPRFIFNQDEDEDEDDEVDEGPFHSLYMGHNIGDWDEDRPNWYWFSGGTSFITKCSHWNRGKNRWDRFELRLGSAWRIPQWVLVERH